MHTSHLDGSCDGCAVSSSTNAPSFAELFKHLRKQLVGKQACLTRAGLRCTDAAISYWERGLRLPRPKTLRNAVKVLVELGATPCDVEQLMSAWTTAQLERKVPARVRVAHEQAETTYAV
jgi:transcriptional regulator with XRE-family HTH domain